MLVCNVSQSRRRVSIAAGVVEAAAALDAPGTGNVVFATLVDDPANVRDTVNAYLGQIMLEVATAAAVVSAGSAFATAVVEAVTAASTQDGTVIGAVPARSAMLPGVFVNSDGTLREANVNGVMVNL
jgi:uncharacterized membrane protein